MPFTTILQLLHTEGYRYSGLQLIKSISISFLKDEMISNILEIRDDTFNAIE